MPETSLIACHDCDLLHRIKPSARPSVAKCQRCGAVLFRHKANSLDHTLAFTIAGLILFTVANSFPFLQFEMQGQVTQTTLITGVNELYVQGLWELAGLVLLTIIVAPLFQLLGLLHVLLPLRFQRIPWKLPTVFRFVQALQPWAMMEVFMLSILVSVVKLGDMAIIVPGIALWSYAALILVLAGSVASLDPEIIWEKIDIAS